MKRITILSTLALSSVFCFFNSSVFAADGTAKGEATDEKGQQGLGLKSGRSKGVELFRRECPDVVVLDLNMPEMGGVAVLQHIRTFKPDQPVIVLTGAGTPEKKQQVHALGVNAFVEKEFSLHRLGDALKPSGAPV